jgi:hypothetical protein
VSSSAPTPSPARTSAKIDRVRSRTLFCGMCSAIL